MTTIADLVVMIRSNADGFRDGFDEAATEASGFERRMDRLGGGMERFGGRMTRSVTPAGIALAGAGGLVANEWNAGIETIVAGSGATGDALDDLVDSSKAVTSDVNQGFGDVSAGLVELNTTLGVTGPVLEDTTESVFKMSDMLGEDATSNAQSFGRAMAQWGEPAEDGTRLLDGLFQVTQDTGLGFNELTGHLQTYGPVLQNAGYEMEEAADLFSQLESNGISVSRVMPGLNSAFRNWADEGKNGRVELENVIDRMKSAENEAEALTIATDTFGAEGAQRLMTAARGGAFELDGLGDATQGADGAIEDAHQATDTLADRMGRLKDRVILAVGPFGELGMVVGGVAAGAGPLISGTGSMIRGLGRLGSVAGRTSGRVAASFARMTASAVAATARMVASIAIQVGRWVLLGVQSLLAAAKVALAWLISLGPIALIVAAVIGAVAIIVANWESVKEFAGQAFDKVKEVAMAAFDWLKENWPLLLAILTGPFGLAVLFITRNWDTIREKAGEALDWIKDRVTGVKDWIVDRFNDVVDFVRGLPGSISSAASGMWDGIKDAFKSAINACIDWWNGLSFTLPTISLPSFDAGPLGSFGGGSVGGQTFSTPDIPRLAQGGIVPATPGGRLVIAGEGGSDEAVIPLPRGLRGAGVGGAGDRPVTLNIAGSVLSERDLIGIIRDELNNGGLRGSMRGAR